MTSIIVHTRLGLLRRPTLALPRLSNCLHFQNTRLNQTRALFTSSQSENSSTPAPNFAYPPHLLIYTAGTRKSFGVAAVKLTIIATFCVQLYSLVVPQILGTVEFDPLEVAKVITVLSIPPIAMNLLTHSFVAHVSVLLPTEARLSKRALDAYMKRIDPSMKLFVQRIKPWGLPSRQLIPLKDLRAVKTSFPNLHNYATVKGQHMQIGFGEKFYIPPGIEGERGARIQGIWSKIARKIEENTKLDSVKT